MKNLARKESDEKEYYTGALKLLFNAKFHHLSFHDRLNKNIIHKVNVKSFNHNIVKRAI